MAGAGVVCADGAGCVPGGGEAVACEDIRGALVSPNDGDDSLDVVAVGFHAILETQVLALLVEAFDVDHDDRDELLLDFHRGSG